MGCGPGFQACTTMRCCAVSLQAEDDATRLAQYLEGRGQAEMAADVWVNASQAERAIDLYAQVCGQTVCRICADRQASG